MARVIGSMFDCICVHAASHKFCSLFCSGGHQQTKAGIQAVSELISMNVRLNALSCLVMIRRGVSRSWPSAL